MKLAFSKINQIMVKWEPKEEYIVGVVKPWKNTIGEAKWASFILKNVFPKLIYFMEEFEINPAEQKLDHIKILFKWLEMMNDE